MKGLILFVALAFALVNAASIELNAVVRDFTPQTNPDFEKTINHDVGAVSASLDVDGKPTLANGPSVTITSDASFAQWYRDVDGVNMKFVIPITLTETTPGVFKYETGAFFPIDNLGFGNYADTGKNFHFTTEIKTQFTFQGTEIFHFSGDDDVWVFINGKLAVDIGGVHGAAPGDVDLSDPAIQTKLGITPGNVYSFHFFHAERHTSESNFLMETSIVLETNHPEEPPAGKTVYLCGLRVDGFCDYRRVPAKRTNQPTEECPADPKFYYIEGAPSFDNYNAISFGDLNINTGDVEGRVAIKNNLFANGFSIGFRINTAGPNAPDREMKFALITGRDANFKAGSIYPDGRGASVKENAFIGGNFVTSEPSFINEGRRTGGPCNACLDADFNNAQAYYLAVQEAIDNHADNAVAAFRYGGMEITCNSNTDPQVFVHIPESDFNQITYWRAPVNCNNNAKFAITVTGSGNVVFGNSPLRLGPKNYPETPNNIENVVYNVLGLDRVISSNYAPQGILLAPYNKLSMTSGVWVGNVIVGSILMMNQINRIFCPPPPNPPVIPPPDLICPYYETECAGLNFPLGEGVFSFRDFDFVAFGDFQGESGDIEGRLAVRNNLNVQDWTIGFQLDTLFGDNSLPYALIVGRNAVYNRGQIHPQGTADQFPGLTREKAFIGGEFTAPEYLLERADGGNNCGENEGCLDQWFDAARQCYKGYQDALNAAPANAAASLIFGDGLLITCSEDASRYTVNVDSSVFNKIRWYALDNCNLQSEWVINIRGEGGVVFFGGSFPSVAGGAIYNVIGEGRNIEVVSSGVEGHILAPFGNLIMNSSVIIGKVVVNNAIRIVQTNRPCPDRRTVRPLVIVVEEPVGPGGHPDFVNEIIKVGDKIVIRGKEYVVIGFDEEGGVILTPPIDSFIGAGETGTLLYDEVNDDRRGNTPAANTDSSSAFAVQAFFALIVAILAFF